jgi:tetratricopeptide (TPR) repeat protein
MSDDQQDDAESRDARIVSAAMEALAGGDLDRAERMLLGVARRAPERYVYRYESGGNLYIKFWDVEEFVYYTTRHGDEHEAPGGRVVWLASAYPRAMYYLGFIRVKRGDFAGAIEWLDRGLRLEPGQPFFRLEKGKALSGLRQYERGLAMYDEVVRMGDEVRANVRAVALRGKGFQLIELGQLDLAEAAFLDSLRLDPQSPVARHELLYIRHLRGGGRQAPVETVQTNTSQAMRCSFCGAQMQGGKVLNVGTRLVWACPACKARLPAGDAERAMTVQQAPSDALGRPRRARHEEAVVAVLEVA